MPFSLFCRACGEAAPQIAGEIPRKCPACDEDPTKWASSPVDAWGVKDAKVLRGMRIARIGHDVP